MAMRRNPRQIFATAIKELSLSKPLDSITIQEIVDLAGYSRKNFYYYFQDKYELVEWAFNYEGEVIIKEGISKGRSWSDIISTFLEEIFHYRQYYATLLSDKGKYALIDSYVTFIIRSMSDYYLRTQPELTEKDAFYIRYAAYGNIRMTKHWLEKSCPWPPAEFASLLVEAFPAPLQEYFS